MSDEKLSDCPIGCALGDRNCDGLMETMGDHLILNCGPDGLDVLGPDTFVVAIDDTGHEAFSDPHHPVFGLGGCCFMVKDYRRLVDMPWQHMCKTFFPDHQRPLHAADLRATDNQQAALKHFFEGFEFCRIFVTVSKDTVNETNENYINMVSNCLLNRICDVAKYVEFSRLIVIIERSQRIEMRIIRSIVDKTLRVTTGDSRDEIKVELGLMPKSAGFAALEVADFIVHTAGAQARHQIAGSDVRKDFDIVFRSVDRRLVSSMHITRINET